MKHFIQYERINFIKISNILITCLKLKEDNFGKKGPSFPRSLGTFHNAE